jgi:quercetin dioxygenase-like cupin family protein/Ca2+-binding EF-hand superfamily protein
MKSKQEPQTMLLAALALICSPAVFCHDDPIAAMDVNHDGKLSSAEHEAGAQKMFATMDADHDGKVTAAEMDAAHPGMKGKDSKSRMSSAAKIKVVDSDGDGILTAQEHRQGSSKMFAKMDSNGDGSLSAAEVQAGHEKMMGHKQSAVASLQDITWGPAPPALPPGAQMAVLAGDPAANELVTLRVKFPAGYTVPPHWHPGDEHVTVLSGSLSLGMGDKVDMSAAKTLTAGGYIVAPARMHHFATTKEGAVVQLNLVGPFAITYVNPADDPRKSTAK